ncbi:hypothetical protein MRQ36_15565 [Micromonospora sp. R77]|uniref:hypothetical protein n=1 Tax=Micromonospora sp. R77 TaxID=2925836 RepID=UPI001F605474|nr:hypothetical protein [Micromonospora sp. R77]MCI4063931.1 hypothetical protein [Micromonospora sp. R77]
MLLEAFAPTLWAATLRTLRELTRLAVTALVLVVGFGGVAATSTVGALRPVAAPEFRSAGSLVAAAPGRHIVADPGSPVVGSSPTVGAAETVDRATGAQDAPAPGVRVQRPDRHEVALRPSARTVVAPADPGRDAVARRGPPLV